MGSYYIEDYFKENEFNRANKLAQNQIQNYKVAFEGQSEVFNNIQKISDQYSALPTDVVVALAINGVNPDYSSLGDIEDEVVNLKVKKEADLWTELYEKYQPEDMEKNMKMTIGDLLTSGFAPGGTKPGDVQYGVWAFAGLDALFQTFGPSGKWSLLASGANALVPGQVMQVGRSQAYLRDIRYYDKLLQDGYTPTEAQGMLQTDVSWTEIEDIGKDTNIVGDIKKHIDMIQEAHKLGGEPLLANMMRQVLNGKPVNFDRGTKATLESIDATKTPMFHDLTTQYGYSEEEAKKFIYSNIGEPIKQFDEDGEIHYTSAENPNKINFYAGRSKQRYMWSGQTAQDFYKPQWSDKNILMEYSPGRVISSEIVQPGSTAFNTLSGTLDATYQIVPEILAGKGLKGIRNVKKGFRGINKAMEATELGLVKQTGKTIKISPNAIADDIIETVADEVDAVTGKGNFDKFVNFNSNTLTKYSDDVVANRKQVRAAAKKLKKEYTVFGRVPRFFQTTKDEVLNQPLMDNFFNALAKTDQTVEHAVATNPILKELHPEVISEILEESNPSVIKKMFGDMVDQGYVVKATPETGLTQDYIQTLDTISDGLLPVKGSFTLNKISQNLAQTGTRLQTKSNPAKRALGRVASTVGNENAAYRNLGSFVGEQGRKVRDLFPGRKLTQLKPVNKNETILDTTQAAGEMIKKQKIVDELDPTYGKLEFEKYMGFSSSYNSSFNPYYRKLLGVVPYLGIPLNNFATGYKQLASHLQVTGYTIEEASQQLRKFRNLDFNDKPKIRKFAYDQMQADVALIKKRGGNDEIVAQIVEEQFNGIQKSKIYATGRDGETLPNPGSRNEVIRLTDPKDGKPKNVEHVTAHLFSEMSDNVVPLLDYRIVNRAMGKVFRAQPGGEAITGVRGFAYDSKEFVKFASPFSDRTTNPFKGGLINTKKLNDDAATMLAEYYTRNVFKPLVLLRAAFFTRVFIEEQARIAVSGMDGFFNHPFRYIQWLSSGVEDSKWAKLPGITAANADGVELLASSQAREAAQKTFLSSDFLSTAKYNRDVKGLEYITKSKVDSSNVKDYTLGAFNELIQLRDDEISRQVARYRYGSKELNDWLYSEAGFAARKKLYDWGGNDLKPMLADKDFIDQYVQSIEARIRVKTGGIVKKGVDYRKVNNTRKYRYSLTSGDVGDDKLRYAIAEGKLFDSSFDLKNAATATRKDYLDFSENPEKTIKYFKKQKVLDRLEPFFTDEGLNLDIGDVKLSQKIDDGSKPGVQDLLDGLDNATNAVFENLMTKPIGYLNRSIVFKQNRWLYVGNKFQYMSDGLRNKYIKEAIDSAVPKSVVDELKGLKKLYPSGAIDDYYTMNNQSKAFGLSMTKQLLYDTTQKHALADKFTNIFPFAEVWFEVFQTWGKLLAENPTVLRKAQVTTRGFGGADALGASSDNGFFTPAPGNSDEEMFVYPWGGFMTDVIFGKDTEGVGISPKGYVAGINLLGQGFVPGPNPMVSFAINKVLPETAWADEVRERMFGVFTPPEKLTDALRPDKLISASYKKFIAWMKDPESFEVINDSSSETEKMRANATIDIFRYGMAAGVHNQLYDDGKLNKHLDKLNPDGWSEDTISKKQISEAYLEYSKYASGDLFMFQFMLQFFGPTGMKPEYVIDDKNGNQWGNAVLYEEYVRIRNKNNNDYLATHNEFLELYGFEHPWVTSPRSQTTGPKEPYTAAAARWKQENKEIYDMLPKGTANYLNLDNPYDERSFTELNVNRQQMSPDLYRRNVNDTIGFLRYKTYSEKVERLDASNEQKVLLKRFYRNALIDELPGFQTDEEGVVAQTSSITKYIEMKDKWVTKTDTGYIPTESLSNQDAAKGFAEMLPFWEEMENISKDFSPSRNPDWWLSSEDVKARTMRIWMYNKAQQIIAEYPEFWGVWTGVMLKLYRDDQEYLDYLPES